MATERISRLIVQNLFPFRRCLSTITETAAPVTHRQMGRILRARVLQTDIKTSIADVLDQWVSEGNQIRRADIVNLVNYYRSRKNYKLAVQICEWAKSSNIEMNNADRAIWLGLLRETQGLHSSEMYFNSLNDMEKTSKTYGVLLSCYCKERKYDKALETFELMKSLNQASTINYNYMLSLYSGMDQPQKVISLVQEMKQKNVAPDIYTYNLLINSYGTVKDLDAIEEVLKEMKKNKVKCDLATCKSLATIYISSGLNNEAKIVLQYMEKMLSLPGEEGFHAFRSLVRFYARMKDISGMNQAWESMKLKYPSPRNTSYYIMVMALAELGDVQELERLFTEWEAQCSIYDIRLLNVILEFYLSRNMVEEANLLHEKSLSRGIQPNVRTLTALTNLCLQRHQIDLALKYLEMGVDKAISSGHHVFPAEETIQSFLNYFDNRKDPDVAKKFVQIMKKVKGFDMSIYDPLLQTTSVSNA